MVGGGIPQEGTWDQWNYYEMEMGYPSERTWEVLWDGNGVPLGCGQSENNSFRHPSDADGKNSATLKFLPYCILLSSGFEIPFEHN